VQQLGDLGGRDRGQDYDQERYAREPGEKADQDQKATGDLEGSYKMRRKSGVWESDLRESENSHGRVDVFENSLREEDQADGQSNEDNASRVPGGSEKSVDLNSSNGRARIWR